MNEGEWLRAADPDPLLARVTGPGAGRRLRLFACGCCRLAFNPFAPAIALFAVRTAETAADGEAADVALDRARTFAEEAARLPTGAGYLAHLTRAAAYTCHPDPRAAAHAAGVAAAVAVADLPGPPAGPGEGAAEYRAERALQAALLRDITGNPFRPAPFDPRWRTADAVGLAEAIYEGRAFGRLPLLADALMDAGCEDEQVIAHCRWPGPHARGCWVVDLVLGKD